jgi:cytochrome c oxidase subunit 2
MKKWVLLIAMTFAPLSAFAADAAAGKALYAVCAACHGQNGEGMLAMNSPKLAGQEEWYLVRQLKAFKDGLRGTAAGDMYGMQMRPMAQQLKDDAAIANVAAYIRTFPAKKPAATVKGNVATGKTLYAPCAACHGANGEGNAQLNGPKLAGQEDWYLVRQLQAYQKGLRGTNPKDLYGMQMKPMAATLTTPQAVNDVVAYISSLAK